MHLLCLSLLFYFLVFIRTLPVLLMTIVSNNRTVLLWSSGCRKNIHLRSTLRCRNRFYKGRILRLLCSILRKEMIVRTKGGDRVTEWNAGLPMILTYMLLFLCRDLRLYVWLWPSYWSVSISPSN